MKQVVVWFQALEKREQILVSVGSVFVVLTLFYLLVFQPTQQKLKQVKAKHEAAEELLAFMQQTNETAKRLRSQPKGATKQIIQPGRLMSYLDSSMQRYGINKQLNSISPGKDNSANLRFDDVEYTKLMEWLGNLYFQNGINIENISIIPTKKSGIVKATIMLL